jgi:hypothetical protein
MTILKTQSATTPKKRLWQSPAMVAIGTISEVLKGGGGKLSPMANDTGDVRKPSGLG